MSPRTLRGLLLITLGFCLEVTWVLGGLLATRPTASPRSTPVWALLFAVAMLAWNRRLATIKENEDRTGLALISGAVALFAALQVSLLGVAGWLTPGKLYGFIWERSGLESQLFWHSFIWLVVLWQRILSLAGEEFRVQTMVTRFRLSLILVTAAWVLGVSWGAPLPFGLILADLALGLTTLALARVEALSRDAAGDVPLNRRWVVMLAAALALTVVLGVAAAGLLARADPGALAPLLGLFEQLFLLFLQAVFWLLQPVFQLLVVLLELLARGLQELPFFQNRELFAPLEAREVEWDLGGGPLLVVLRVAISVLAVVVLLWLIARFSILAAAVLLWLIARSLARLRALRRAPEEGGRESIYEQGMLADDLRGLLRGGLSGLGAAARRLLPGFETVETVRALYKNVQLYGARLGSPRPPQATPAEYLVTLHGLRPDQEADLRALTDAYVAAHYGERQFSREELLALQAAWQRVATGAGGGEHG
ncbi:MAG TPA: DUF4129 domain-containing protein [Ardenticatenaceae bacterium]|nr:DUF4129 domain-containing protein [Ardenticatenaceae bacterium]